MKIYNKNLPWVDESQKIVPTSIVLHWWQVPSWFGGIDYLVKGLKRWKTSVQFAVTKEGHIYQLVPDPTVLCHHARGANKSSIGIEIQGLNARSLDKNKAQFEAVIDLVKYLQDKYDIQTGFKVKIKPELRFYGVTSHKQVDPYCGKRLLWYKRDVHDAYLEKVKSRLS
jgi:hypothetical protein